MPVRYFKILTIDIGNFDADRMQITSYGGDLVYTVYSESSYGGTAVDAGPDTIIHVCFYFNSLNSELSTAALIYLCILYLFNYSRLHAHQGCRSGFLEPRFLRFC